VAVVGFGLILSYIIKAKSRGAAYQLSPYLLGIATKSSMRTMTSLSSPGKRYCPSALTRQLRDNTSNATRLKRLVVSQLSVSIMTVSINGVIRCYSHYPRSDSERAVVT